ncbi:MAG: type IV toxin-antitoxin system AbiEi family antitoxin domain-containing protein [Betaproteobacteria bacterium]
MGTQKRQKLNQLQELLAEGLVVPRWWLEERGYSGALLKKYTDGGWLLSPARGAYRRPGAALKWQHVAASLQRLSEYSLHIGGRAALVQRGRAHYIPMRGSETILLYGPEVLPAWVNALGLPERFEMRNDAMFGSLRVTDTALTSAHDTAGLVITEWGSSDWKLCYSVDERAMLEVLQDVPQRETVHDADILMQGLLNLRPRLLSRLLAACTSIKVKRLFLALAERHEHAWFKHLDLQKVELGTGKRMLSPGGKLHPKYLITLPGDLDDHAR